MSRQEEVGTIELPQELIDRIDARIPYTEFDSVAEYVTHVLKDVLHHVEAENDLENADSVDEDQVREQLKSLGYLNE